MKRCFLSLMALLVVAHVGARHKIYSPSIRSLTATVNGDWLNQPVMQLGSSDELLIGFDELSHNFHRYLYTVERCEPDWTPSTGLLEHNWLEGFNGNPIDDYRNSLNTTVLYTHYQFVIPNDQCRLTMSGNYRLTVTDDETEERVVEVEFRVVEPLMTVGLGVTTNTDIDVNRSHQQLEMTLNYNDLRVRNVEEELRTVVMQNWREDNARLDVAPNYVSATGLRWAHNRALIFDAGNEYHKYEVLDVSHPTMGIDRIDWDGHRYNVYPFPCMPRRNYLTDVDADGAFCIRNSDRSEVDYTCDYVWVHHSLVAPYAGELYIDGHWATDADREAYRMAYDTELGAYHATVMLKQGYYSYHYLTADGGIPPSEGSFYQTSNRYQAFVYYRERGGRTWRLVGYRAIDFR